MLRADIYVAATGVKPNLELLAGAGVETRWGVLVDDALRTNVADVYAAGDVAETVDRLTGERYVHAIFPNAVAQGADRRPATCSATTCATRAPSR